MNVTNYQLRVERELDGQKVRGGRTVKAEDLARELHFEASQPGTIVRLDVEARYGYGRD